VEPRSKRGNSKHYTALGKHYYVRQSSQGFSEKGIASWYGSKFHGRRTANGERYNMYAMSAAHPTLPIPTYVRVTNLGNYRSVVVRINDRGPFVENRVIDLSYTAASKLGMLQKGTALVKVEAIDPRNPTQPPTRSADNIPASLPSLLESAVREVTRSASVNTWQKPIETILQQNLYLQVGSFSDQVNANRLQQTLSKSMQPTVLVKKGYRNQQPFYRVQIGPLDSAEQVDRLTAYVRQFDIRNTLVVIE